MRCPAWGPKVRTALVVFLLLILSRPARADPCPSNAQREVCRETNIFLMPGAQAVFFAPRGAHEPFFGGGVQLAPLHWSHNNREFGPSQGDIFLEASLLRSSGESSTLALYDVGFALSFERNSSRKWLIPYFGSTLGATLHQRLPNTGYVYPFVGVHVYWHPHFIFDIDGGYHFPFAAVDEMRGPRVQATACFSLW